MTGIKKPRHRVYIAGKLTAGVSSIGGNVFIWHRSLNAPRSITRCESVDSYAAAKQALQDFSLQNKGEFSTESPR